ncbi:MAG TPA: glycosyltransferase family 2 protein [Gemmatimonadaceae bacterium]|nr:glycosyltransferase family 2 protein [Gemmatimonadaceae bacterium]
MRASGSGPINHRWPPRHGFTREPSSLVGPSSILPLSLPEESLRASHDVPGLEPLLTIGIPHYKWRRYLEVVLESIFAQDLAAFEIVVSDDSSPDDSAEVLPAVLRASGRQFRYYRQGTNLGYDGNVRFCLNAARGRYVMLLGNDDALGTPDTLSRIAAALAQLQYPEVAFTNFEDWSLPGSVVRRALATRLLGEGIPAAVRFFRSFSFVSGLIFDSAQAARFDTDRWDRSVYYQIYLASRIMATGGRLASLDIPAVRKDVRVDGKTVVNYATKVEGAKRSFAPRHTGLDNVIRVAVDGTLPYVPARARSATLRRIISQIFTITYPFWLFEYRRVGRWSFAVGIARSMAPRRLLAEYPLSGIDRAYLTVLFYVVSALGLLLPLGVFTRGRDRVGRFVRQLQQRVPARA